MTTYKDLTPTEKYLFDNLEKIFLDHIVISNKSFVRVLAVLINKYKFKRLK